MIDIQNISDKAGKLFKKFGIKSITMDDIAREIGISKKTLYQFVSDKNELIERIVKTDISNLRSDVSKLELENLDPIKELIELNKRIYLLFEEYSPTIEHDLRKYYIELFKEVQQNLVDLFIQALKKNIERGKSEKVYRDDINSEVIAKLHISQIEKLTQPGIFTSGENYTPVTMREVCLFHINGLITKKGQTLLEKHINEINNK